MTRRPGRSRPGDSRVPWQAELARIADDVDEAGRQLDAHGPAAIDRARTLLERATARLRPLTADHSLSPGVARRVAQSRAALSSHLLAARDVAAAGAPPTTVARVLRRAVSAHELDELADGDPAA